jgi:hypothetical protein
MLAHKSVRRWRRSSGDIFIVKNRFNPAHRHGYEVYSAYSADNLLTSSMLATAYMYCNDSLPEGPEPAEVGGFVFEIRDFHKLFANVGGMYVEIETLPNRRYDSLGLARVHVSDVDPLVMPSASSSFNEGGLAIASPTFYNEYDHGGRWEMMGQASCPEHLNYTLEFSSWNNDTLTFAIGWDLSNTSLMYHYLTMQYAISPQNVKVELFVDWRGQYLGFSFAVFLFDGENNSTYNITEGIDAGVSVRWLNSTQQFKVTDTPSLGVYGLPCSCIRLPGEVASRNGYLANVRCTVKLYEGNVGDAASITYMMSPKVH